MMASDLFELNENQILPPYVIKQLARELKNLNETPPEGIKVVINDDNFSTIFADIEGPHGTPYENGIFRMKLLLSSDFPQLPPKGFFMTKIFHPNVSTKGDICVNALKKDWNANLGLRHVLLVVKCLLIHPFPESALNEQAGRLLLKDYIEYARLARLYTSIHALKSKSKILAMSESSTLNIINSPLAASSTKTSLNIINSPIAASSKAPMSLPTNLKEASEPNVDVSVVTTVVRKKKAQLMSKAQVEKKKVDPRKKSLRRL